MRGNPRGRPLALLALALVAGLAAIAAVASTTGDALADVRTAWTGSGTIHARFYGRDGRLVGEEWLDKKTQRSRRVQYGAAGDEITVQDGNVVTSWNSRGLGAVYQAVALAGDDPWVLRSSSLLRFRRLLDDGSVEIVGKRQVDGNDALVLRAQAGPDVAAGTAIEVLIDAETLLPVAAGPASGGDEQPYRIVARELRATELALVHPPGRPSIVDRRLRETDLRGALDVPVYVLDEAAGLTAGSIGVREQDDGDAPVPPTPHVFVTYGGGTQTELELVERDASSEQGRAELAALTADATKMKTVVNGKAVPVYVTSDEGASPVFALTVGRTLVSGYASTSVDELLALLRYLRRV